MVAVNSELHGAIDSVSDWGDTVDSDGEADVEDASEPLERYEQGLYYPTCIGEVLAEKYRIEHKLGHGGFSTVWMAHHLPGKKDVALKIMTPGEAGEREYKMQNEITSHVRDTSRLITYQDTFLLRGARDYHRVLVFPLQGPTLRDHARRTPVAARRSAAKQLLQALKALHDCGLVHRGALH
jgi:serine/threonine protein kinase